MIMDKIKNKSEMGQENIEESDLKQKGEKRLSKFVEIIGDKNHEKTFGFLSDLQKKFPESEMYLVGGLVRDKILGRKSHDIDILVRNVPAEELEIFLTKRGKTEFVEVAQGVYRFTPEDANLKEVVNIALPRKEMSTGPSHKEFDVQCDPYLPIEKDLSRRDFTINAMAWDTKNKNFIDPCRGVADLKMKLIRTVEDPSKTFTEDYSRILRALRFACLLDFEIEKKTWSAIKEYGSKILGIVPWDIMGREFAKTLYANPEKALDLYDEAGILKIILPEIEVQKGKKQSFLEESEEDIFTRAKQALRFIKKNASLELKLAVLLHNIESPTTFKKYETGTIEKICDRLRFSKKTRDQVCWLIENRRLLLKGDIFQMKPRAIKKYFIDNPILGNELLEISEIERLTSLVGVEQEESFDKMKEMIKYIDDMRQAFKTTETKNFTDIISGNDIKEKYNIKQKLKIDQEKMGGYLEEAEKFIIKYITEKSQRPNKEEVLEYLEKIKI